MSLGTRIPAGARLQITDDCGESNGNRHAAGTGHSSPDQWRPALQAEFDRLNSLPLPQLRLS